MVDWSKGRVGEVEDLIEGLWLCICEIGDLIVDFFFDMDEIEVGNVGFYSKGLEDSDEIEIWELLMWKFCIWGSNKYCLM